MQNEQRYSENKVGIIFPHQLFEINILPFESKTIYLVEEFLFFKQYKFHKQKLVFHRASMKFYESYLRNFSLNVVYIDAFHEHSDVRKLIPYLKSIGVQELEYIDPADQWLEKRMVHYTSTSSLKTVRHNSPSFLNNLQDLELFFNENKKYNQTDFYKNQRLSRTILLETNLKPRGGKWTFDDENRHKYPLKKIPPGINFPAVNGHYKEAIQYVQTHFSGNVGTVNLNFIYPTTFQESKEWLGNFLNERFLEFGTYEDAIVKNEYILHHSLLSPLMNAGLLTPTFVIQQILKFAEMHNTPLNSTEGLVRQIIGWREFIRALYEFKGVEQRTKNYWQFSRKIPKSFWNGTTGIDPIDTTIKKILNTGYCHHIERLMVVGNFMLLCEFNPDEVYLWFMEMFIDAYDWVMVPNIYGMSQFADGGLMASKPYISGSNYLLKMSDYPKGPWQKIWDGLFWRFMDKHRNILLQNPRLGMLISSFDKMEITKKESHLNTANQFLDAL